jgi:hypothetical protein
MSSFTPFQSGRSGPRLGRWPTALGAILLIAASGWATWPPGLAVEPATATATAQATPMTGGGTQAQGAAAQPLPASTANGAAPPEGLSPPQWASLQQALAQHPDREREQARVLAYLHFQHQVDQWRNGPSGMDRAQRAALGEDIAAQLPTRLRNGELLPIEAEELLAAIAPEREAQADRQAAWVASQKARWHTALTPAEQAAQARAHQQDEAFARQSQAITARWLSAPEAERDQTALETALQQLRVQVYGR